MMIDYILPLLSSYLSIQFIRFWFFPLIALAFLASFPRFVRRLTEWR